MKNKYGVIYKITNKRNNKMYIGKTTSKDPKKYILLTYMNTNGKTNRHIHNAIKKHGKENFSYEIIDEAKSLKELNTKEQYYIENFNTLKKGYNMTIGEDGGDTYTSQSKKKKQEIKQKIKKNRKITKEFCKKMSDINKGIPKSEEHKRKISESKKQSYIEGRSDISGSNHPMYGKHHTKKSRKKTSDTIKKLYENQEYRKKVSDATRKALNKPETKKKMSDASYERWSDPKYRQKMSEKKKGIVPEWLSHQIGKNHPRHILIPEEVDLYIRNNYGKKKNDDIISHINSIEGFYLSRSKFYRHISENNIQKYKKKKTKKIDPKIILFQYVIQTGINNSDLLSSNLKALYGVDISPRRVRTILNNENTIRIKHGLEKLENMPLINQPDQAEFS